MTKPIQDLSGQLVRDGISAVGFFRLADACTQQAKDGAPILMWTALAAFFRTKANFLDDRPTPSAEVDQLLERVRPLLETLSQPFDGPNVIERQFEDLRDLL